MASAGALEFAERAVRDLEGLSTDAAARVVRRLRDLEVDARPRGDTVKRLQGFSRATYRFRVGDYRAIFRVDGPRILILRVVHRSDLVRALGDLL